MMIKKIICIYCPRGCVLTVREDPADGIRVEGNACPKGIDYARQEMTNPVRMLTTTVRTVSAVNPRLPVRLSEEIPKSEIMRYMEKINSITVDHDCRPGDAVASDLFGTGVNLIATGEYHNER